MARTAEARKGYSLKRERSREKPAQAARRKISSLKSETGDGSCPSKWRYRSIMFRAEFPRRNFRGARVADPLTVRS